MFRVRIADNASYIMEYGTHLDEFYVSGFFVCQYHRRVIDALDMIEGV
jgi:hypothetical protein